MVLLLVILLITIIASIYYLLHYPSLFEAMFFDKNNQGIHVLTSRKHGNPDGESYREYYHYYINFPDGNIYSSKAIQENTNTKRTLKKLIIKTGLELELDYNTKIINLKSNQVLLKNKDYTIVIYTNKKQVGKCNLFECRKTNQQLVISTYL